MSTFLPYYLKIECPRCKAPVGQSCRTLTTDVETLAHQARKDAGWPLRAGQRS